MSILGKHQIPDFTSVDVYQGYNDTCAIRSQQLVLRDFGINVMEEELMAEAHANGWYDLSQDSGTHLENIGNLLESHNIPIHKYSGASILDLQNELAQGHKIIAVVDSDELMDPLLRDASPEDLTPNHALLVVGIDTTDPSDPKVILTDPGTGHVAQPYSLSHFSDAALDSGNFFVATNNPVPNLQNFDYEKGHINGEIDGLSYEEWRDIHADKFSEPIYYSEINDPEGADEQVENLPFNNDGCLEDDSVDDGSGEASIEEDDGNGEDENEDQVYTVGAGDDLSGEDSSEFDASDAMDNDI